MIEISGSATYSVSFCLEVDKTEEEWDGMSEMDQQAMIDELIGMEGLGNAEIEDANVYDLIVVIEEESA